jgi:fimbrial isopeptide formation D2 family protein
MGFIFVAIAMFVQIFAAMYPAERSLASSPNHIINGLSDSKSSVLSAWDNNTGNVRAIYRKFGINRDNLAAMSSSPSATVKSSSSDWWSIGRLPLSNFGVSGSEWGERTVNAEGNIVYQRPLKAWDKPGTSSTYKAFKGTNEHGKTFWILKDCGNLTFQGSYLPSPPTPKLELHKTLMTDNKVKAGETVKFRLEYRNTVDNSLATNFKLTDTISDKFEFVSLGGMTSRSGNTLTISRSNGLGYTANPTAEILVVKVKQGVKAGTVICNQTTATTTQTGSKKSEQPCVTVVANPEPAPAPKPVTPPSKPDPDPEPKPAPKPTPTPPSPVPAPAPPAPVASGYCIASLVKGSATTTSVKIATEVFTDGSTKVAGYTYDVGVNGLIDSSVSTSDKTYTQIISNLPSGQTVSVAVRAQLENGSAKSETAICPIEVTANEIPRVIQSKSVSNTTSGTKDANKTSVNVGDTLIFKLTTENVTSSDYKKYQGQDYFGDVLNYAQVLDMNQLSKQGIKLDKDGYLRWTSPVIKANTSEVKTITVKIKDIIPSTNQPSSASHDFDCEISNKYGNEVIMNVNCPLVKNIEQVTNTLPNTGPGAGMVISVGLAMLVGYFFMRSRLIGKELELLRNEFNSGGI